MVTEIEIGKAYGFFDCNAAKEEIEGEIVYKEKGEYVFIE